MFSDELMELLIQVIKSWQVIAITAALVVYMFMVSYVSRTYHRPTFVSRSKPQKSKKKAAPAAKTIRKESVNNELGLAET
jgi:hypothetical protein